MRRKPKVIPVRSTLLSVVLILSAVLFVCLALVACKSENDARRKAAELPSNPPHRTGTYAGDMQPPPPPPAIPPSAKAMRVGGGVVGGIAGGVAGGRIAGQLAEREFNTEEYGRFEENAFLKVTDNPLSTFSIDVDRASYSN